DQTGFVNDCATSWWTTDSPKDPANLSLGYFWQDYGVNPNPASKCASVTGAQIYSDAPDGPTVEKGAIAEVVRKDNNPATTDSNPTWTVNRTFLTTLSNTSTGAPAAGIASASALDTTQKNWLAGQDTQNEDADTNLTETRASLHGDVVHSRPLPVNYGDQVVVYYGANDGNFRAVHADTGKELWTLVPYEFAQPGFVERLRTNEPLVSYPNVDMSITPTPRSKDYAWDGSIGLLAAYNDSHALTKAWIYPTMRRGGKRIYALDVTTPTATPTIKWIVGCNRDGSNCSAGFDDIGQTWSTPNPAPVAGYNTEQVAFFGGGYDTCEDANTVSPACGAAKGRKVYAVDAGSGALLKALDTDRSVPADIALLDIDADGKADYGYAADTGGNLYRIDMVTRVVAPDGAVGYTVRAPGAWTIRKIAATSGGGRKFLFAPALFPIAKDGRVYVAIGSGDREHPLQTHYPFAGVTNRFYVYLDNLAVTSGDAISLDALSDVTDDVGCESPLITATSMAKGWFMDLNQYGQGEQTVTSAIIAGGLIAFSTNRPIPPAAGTCGSALGEARGYWVSLLSGSGAINVDGTCGGARSSPFVGGGLPPSPVIGTVPIGGTPRTVVIGAVQKGGGASTPISPQKITPSISPVRKRVYWKLQGTD
ncbi:MAG: PilC/PilY family type IV pilus protein, partial [Rhodocyclaceae bacterium]|nr:PilC/PilY family type IV pilus protein [Rhodocyclaceae bacterium]